MGWRLRLVAVGVWLTSPTMTLAAGGHDHLTDLPVWSVIPFAGLLLSIAIFPLVAPYFWHSNRNRLIVAMIWAVPVVAYLLYLNNSVYLGKELKPQYKFNGDGFKEPWGTNSFEAEEHEEKTDEHEGEEKNSKGKGHHGILLAKAVVGDAEAGTKLLFASPTVPKMTAALEVADEHESHHHKTIEFVATKDGHWHVHISGEDKNHHEANDSDNVLVSHGDTIVWRVESGEHGVVFPSQQAAETVLKFKKQPGLASLGHAMLEEYIPFICLLGSLYVISGGIVVSLRVRPNPLVNGGILAFGAVIANAIGTTGASMLLIRPYLKVNESRAYRGHLPIFFIFTVSNLGGLLTPLGDPPLFLGYLRGVDFFWTLRLWPAWGMTNAIVLTVFLVWDTITIMRDPGRKPKNEPTEPEQQQQAGLQGPAFGLRGIFNFLWLAGVIAAVLSKPFFADLYENTVKVPEEYKSFANLTSEGIMLLMATLSMVLTPRRLRKENGYSWEPIIEVAALFIGIFITMVPALALLQENSSLFPLKEPWQYFWITGGLSGFLDNAPTYLTFATVAGAGLENGIADLPLDKPKILEGISCGAVFMGAMTYIGNGPNFMVKAISDEVGYRTPSFFGYLGYSCVILLPIFVLVTVVFFPWF
ncbi:MAG: sodium:proton antiporter [Gemmataceae bacterium]